MWKPGPSVPKGLRKSDFSVRVVYPIFACGCLCRPEGKLKIQKKYKKKIKTLGIRWRRRESGQRACALGWWRRSRPPLPHHRRGRRRFGRCGAKDPAPGHLLLGIVVAADPHLPLSPAELLSSSPCPRPAVVVPAVADDSSTLPVVAGYGSSRPRPRTADLTLFSALPLTGDHCCQPSRRHHLHPARGRPSSSL